MIVRTIACLLFCTQGLLAQTTIDKDPEISSMVEEVHPDSLKSYITTLVAFGTRSTVSSVTDPSRGIGAARNWVLSTFQRFAASSGGRLTAFLDTTTYAPDGQRVAGPINLGNVVATLRGSDTADHRTRGASDNRAPGRADDGAGHRTRESRGRNTNKGPHGCNRQ